MAIPPAPGMKVKWRSVYWPVGEWVDENGEVVDITRGFKAINNSAEILVVMSNKTSPSGHGEPSITAPVPLYIHAETLELLPLPTDFIEII